MQEVTHNDPKVHLISLGCSRNRVDSEVMLGTMIEDGWKITDEPEGAQAIVVNTCGFIGPAKEESVNTILEAAEYKKANPGMKLVVSGCLTQRYKRQLVKGMPEVDLWLGTDEFPKIAEYMKDAKEAGSIHAKRSHYIYSEHMPRINTLSKHSAYVKVAEGCQHNCSFCIIPAIRGKLRSRPVDSVVNEVKKLVEDGVIEVNLIAQDLAAYGRDLDTADLLMLLRELVKIEGLKWVRLLYVYPENISDEFLEFFATEEKIVKYLDIPVQHASDRILGLMKRVVTREQLISTVEKVKNRVPEVSIRTSVMVGFPSETDQDFMELKSFVEMMKFDHLGCFTYSMEEGTVAGCMDGQVDEEVKLDRQAQIMSVQKEISADRLEDYVGRIVPVLVTGVSKETDLLMEGRMSTQAPEVDGVVYINDGDIKIGEIQLVEITEAHDYDLVGRVVTIN